MVLSERVHNHHFGLLGMLNTGQGSLKTDICQVYSNKTVFHKTCKYIKNNLICIKTKSMVREVVKP